MSDRSNLCYIIDYQRTFYKVDENNQLVVAEDKESAGLFTPKEADERISGGRKAQFYSTLSVQEDLKETLYGEAGVMDWMEYLRTFRFLVATIEQYKADLNDRLSKIDLKICDVLHYIELYDVQESENEYLVNLLKELGEERREVKDEMIRTEAFQTSIGTAQNAEKAKEAVKQIKKLDKRKYVPRELPELFTDSVLTEKEVTSNQGELALVQSDNTQTDNTYIGMTYEENLQEDTMEYSKKETVLDGKQIDWKKFAQQQIDFYGNIKQYITNRYIRVDELDARIEEILLLMEDANYNVAQAYKVFKELKDCRNERKEIMTELEYLEAMAGCFDCEAMYDAYRYSLDVIENVLGKEVRKTEIVNDDMEEMEVTMVG